MHVCIFLSVAVFLSLLPSSVSPLKCSYDFSSEGVCSVIKPEEESITTSSSPTDSGEEKCPEFCLYGNAEDRPCTGCGVSCENGAYGQCSWSSGSIFGKSFNGTPESTEFSFSFTGVDFGVSCGTPDSPARILAISGDDTCLTNQVLLIGQSHCDLVVRLLLSRTSQTTCADITHIFPDCLCSWSACPDEEVCSSEYYNEFVSCGISLDPGSGFLNVTVNAAGRNFTRSRTWTKQLNVYNTTTTEAIPGEFVAWPQFTATVCNDITLVNNWCGDVETMCFSSGEGSKRDCDAASSECVSSKVGDIYQCSNFSRSFEEVRISHRFYLPRVLSLEIPRFMAPWQYQDYRDNTFPLELVAVIVTVVCLLCVVFVLCIFCAYKKRK